jgi:integral membrane protein (TIGR01906 family)
VPQTEFSSQVLPDGTPLFNAREISHMLDVRNLTAPVLSIWFFLCVFFLAVIWFACHKKWTSEVLKSLRNGGVFTILLIIGILMGVWMNFNLLFTRFHQIFFTGDSWLFYLSDNLIRLFPLRFWSDLFIFIGAFTMILCLIPIFLYRMISHPGNKKAQ